MLFLAFPPEPKLPQLHQYVIYLTHLPSEVIFPCTLRTSSVWLLHTSTLRVAVSVHSLVHLQRKLDVYKMESLQLDFVEVGEVEGRKIWQKGRLLSNNCVFISETLLTTSRGRGRSSTDASRQHTRTLQPQSHSGGQIHGCASHLSPLAEIFLIISQSNSWFKVSGWIDQMAQTWIWKLKNFSLCIGSNGNRQKYITVLLLLPSTKISSHRLIINTLKIYNEKDKSSHAGAKSGPMSRLRHWPNKCRTLAPPKIISPTKQSDGDDFARTD